VVARVAAPLYPEASDADLLDSTLWRLEFADGNFCVAEADANLYLVLFTSTENAREFLEGGSVQGPLPVSAVVYSESRAQFEQVARLAAADGLHGAVIDPRASGQVNTIVDFARASEPTDLS
jgi:hypothetical protein